MVFRGSSNYCGTTVENNIRLKTQAFIDQHMVDLADNIDFKITNYDRSLLLNVDNSIDFTRGKTNLNKDSDLSFVSPIIEDSSDNLKIIELSKFKYILYLDSYGASYKYSYLMTLGSVIIKLKSDNILWYNHLLKPQMISVDLIPNSDHILIDNIEQLPDALAWCLSHDNDCEIIGKNAQILAETILNENTVINYLQKTVVSIHNKYDVSKSNLVSFPKHQYDIRYEHMNIDINQSVSMIVYQNKNIIEGYFDVSLTLMKKSRDIKSTYETVKIDGNSYNCNKCYAFLDDMNKYEISKIEMNQELILHLKKTKSDIENHFNVYITIDNTTAYIYANKLNTKSIIEYLDISQNELAKILLVNVRNIDLVVDVIKLNNPFVQTAAIVLLCRDSDSKIFNEEPGALRERTKYINAIKSKLEAENISSDVFYFKQSLNTSMSNISSHIIVHEYIENDDRLLIGKLKTNPIGLLKVSNGLIPKIYENLIIININTVSVKSIGSDFGKCIKSIDAPISLINNHFLVVKDRVLLNSIPDDLYGLDISDLSEILTLNKIKSVNFADIQYIIKNNDRMFIDYENMGPDHDTLNYTSFLFHKNRSFINEDYFTVNIHKPMSIEKDAEIFEIDFNDRTLPIVLEFDQRPKDIDMTLSKNITKWIVNYINQYYEGIRVQINSNIILIYEDSNTCNAILRLLPGIEFMLRYDFQPTIINSFQTKFTDTYLEITILERDSEMINESVNIIPYYTIQNKYYIRNITPEMISIFGQLITKLREQNQPSPGIKLTLELNKTKLYITRIGDFAFIFDNIKDDVEIYDLRNKQVIVELPDIIKDLDLNMLLILFKDQNDSLFKLLDNRESYRFIVDPIDVNKLIIPDYKSMEIKPKSLKYSIDRFTSTFLSQEPEITNYGDKVHGHAD